MLEYQLDVSTYTQYPCDDESNYHKIIVNDDTVHYFDKRKQSILYDIVKRVFDMKGYHGQMMKKENVNKEYHSASREATKLVINSLYGYLCA